MLPTTEWKSERERGWLYPSPSNPFSLSKKAHRSSVMTNDGVCVYWCVCIYLYVYVYMSAYMCICMPVCIRTFTDGRVEKPRHGHRSELSQTIWCCLFGACIQMSFAMCRLFPFYLYCHLVPPIGKEEEKNPNQILPWMGCWSYAPF